MLWSVSRWYLHLHPRICLDANNAGVIIVILLDGSSKYLTDANRIHFLRSVCLRERSNPCVHKCRCHVREHHLRGACIPFEVLICQFVVSGITHLPIVDHAVMVQSGIVREADVLVFLLNVLQYVFQRPMVCPDFIQSLDVCHNTV